MTQRSPIVHIALDAFDCDVAQNLAAAGRLPNLARLFARSARVRLQNPYGLFVSSLWYNFATALRPDRHRFHCWDAIDVASYERRLTAPPAVSQRTFWRELSEAGRRVAVFDVPHSLADTPINGLQVCEWGAHDRHFGYNTWPPRKATDIASAFGLHPILGVDPYANREFAADDYVHRAGVHRTGEENRAFLDGLTRGIAAKGALLRSVLAEEKWDLFLAVFGESHAVGHQQWHLHDAGHPRYDAAAARALGGDPVATVYAALDAELGALVEMTDDRTTLLVQLSHGMGPHYDGTHLLDEVLSRIDAFDRGFATVTGPRSLLRHVKRTLARATESPMSAYAVPAARRRIARGALVPCPEFATAKARARQRFFLEPNNTVYGGVRLNLAGREPRGCVDPDRAEEVCARLAADLLALVNVDTGDPVIRAVERSSRWYRRSPDDQLPDLFIDWHHAKPVETVWSQKTGTVHAPYTHWRTGDHRPQGLLLASGPGIPGNTTLPDLDIEDLGVSTAARLGVRMEDVDGAISPWMIAR